MIDLTPSIRNLLLSDSTLSNMVTPYLNSRAIFTRRPIPEDAIYPCVVISPLVSDRNYDFVSCTRREYAYDITAYGNNLNDEKYVEVEDIAFRIANLIRDANKFSFSLPSGISIININHIGPLPAPTDDNDKIARVVTLELDLLFS